VTRRLLAAVVVAASALVVGVALTAAVSLGGGFDRAASRADLPDLIVRFGREERAEVDRRLRALPNVEARAYRFEINDVYMAAGSGSSRRAAIHIVDGPRRGYAVLSGRDARGPDEAVLEQGVARAWGVRVGDPLDFGRFGAVRVVGIGLSPDNVAFPLAVAPRVYIDRSAVQPGDLPVNLASVWLRDRSREDVTLTQARAVSYGLEDLRFVTRAGVQVLIGQAAGIVIALLVAFSLVAAGTAGVVLGASARSEVARRLPAIGVERALGFSRGAIARGAARRAALVAAPAAALGLLVGWLAMRGPADRLLSALNELGPGAALVPWLAGAWALIVGLVAAASAWPAWRATRAPVAALLRGGELAAGGEAVGGRGGSFATRGFPRGGAGFAALGGRLGLARRARWLATTAVLAVSTATVVLLLALASLLVGLRDDPATVGRSYALTAQLGEDAVADVEALPGVAAAAPRYQLEGSAAFSLGQPLRIVAFPRGAEDFERPPLAEGRRRRGPDEVEVGAGLAETLGLRPGATLAVALGGGAEARFRVAGVVRALENEGRVAYARTDRLEALGVLTAPQLAIRVERGADRAAISRGLERLGAPPAEAAAATTRNEGFLSILATVLRVVALAVALTALVVLAQTLVLTARERRPTLALLRTLGGGTATLAAVLAGATATVVVPALVAGVALEWIALGPAVASLAAGYAGLSLAPTAGQIALTAGGLVLLAALAVALVTARVGREPVVAGLREEA